MKKSLLIIGSLALMLVLGGCGAKTPAQVDSTPMKEVKTKSNDDSSRPGAVESVKNAVMGGDVLKCEQVINNNDGSKTYMTYYYKMNDAGMKYRNEVVIGKGTPVESTVYGTMDANKDSAISYSWTKSKTSTAPGYKMDLNSKCMQDMMNNPAIKEQVEKNKKEQELATDTSKSLAERSADLKANMEKISGTTCQYVNDNVDFSVPSDMKFTDYCEMFGDISKMMKSIGQ